MEERVGEQVTRIKTTSEIKCDRDATIASLFKGTATRMKFVLGGEGEETAVELERITRKEDIGADGRRHSVHIEGKRRATLTGISTAFRVNDEYTVQHLLDEMRKFVEEEGVLTGFYQDRP